ncbi:hypothetical protein GCM10010149_75620 [Nonomuraea roseoviolacea subsp. roseoviolacea]
MRATASAFHLYVHQDPVLLGERAPFGRRQHGQALSAEARSVSQRPSARRPGVLYVLMSVSPSRCVALDAGPDDANPDGGCPVPEHRIASPWPVQDSLVWWG